MRLALIAVTALFFAGSALPDELDDSFKSLQEAQSKPDPALVKKLAAQTCELARKVTSTPAPENPDEKEAWAKRVEYARGIELNTEYALYSVAVQGAPAVTVELLAALEQQNPKSKYLDGAYASYFHALNQTGGAAKIRTVAGKAIANFPDNEDLLLVLANSALTQNQFGSAAKFASRLVASVNKHSKPEGMPAADWQRKRTAALGSGYWILGVAQASQNNYVAADEALRAALPLIEGDEARLAAALFYLGVSNYQVGRLMNSKAKVLEGAKFSDRAAAMKSDFAQQAWRNARAMRDEALKMR